MSARWSVAPSGDRFQRDGKDAFLLADTVWAAFASPTDGEWDAYLRLRRAQGFDAVLVSVLAIPHDRSPEDPVPFAEIDGRWDVGRLDPGYFDRVRERITRSTEAGLEVIPILLWNAYLPGTWGSRMSPGLVMSDDQRENYLRIALDALLPHAQFVLVSGDDNLDSEEAITRYVAAAAVVREAAPQALIGMHTGPTARYSSELAAQDWDFYGYQSGHYDDWSAEPLVLSNHHLGHRIRRPVLNLEPPYEGHARVDGTGRHLSRDVRGASWTSVLSGAAAGLGYGAHGVWGWHRDGQGFSGVAFSGMPAPFDQGLHYPGADDVAFLKELVERHALYPLRSRPDLLVAAPPRTLAAASVDQSLVAVYAPEPAPVQLSVDLSAYRSFGYDLTYRVPIVGTPARRIGSETVLETNSSGDVLYVFTMDGRP